MKLPLLPALLFGAPALFAQDAATIHYWDMDTLDTGTSTTPVDVAGDIPTTSGGNMVLEDTTYSSAPSGGNYLKTERTNTGIPLLAEVFAGGPTAMEFGTGSFSFSYWTYNDTSDDNGGADIRGPRIFDCLQATTTGLQLGTQAQGIFNFRIDDDAGGELISNTLGAPFDSLMPTTDQWVHVAVTVNRDPLVNLAEIFFDAVSQGTYDVAGLTGNVEPSQNLQIGCINRGGNASGIQTGGLDDLAFYTGVLTQPQITALADGGQPDLIAPPPPRPAPTPVGHYWDFDSQIDFIPVDLHGNLDTRVAGFVSIGVSAEYGEAYPGAGVSLNSSLFFGDHLLGEAFARGSAVALDFGTGSFAISFWTYNDTGDGDPAGATVFDFLAGAGAGAQLGTDTDGIFQLQLNDDAGNSIVSNTVPGFESLTVPGDQWVHVVLNIDRTTDLLQVFFDGSAIPAGAIDLSALTGNISASQDLEIGVRDGGLDAAGTQDCGLDDFAIYPGTLTPQQVADLFANNTSPLDLLATFAPSGAISIELIDFNDGDGEFTVVFGTRDGATYSVYGGEDLAAIDSWPEISDSEIVGDGDPFNFGFAPPGSPPRYFFEVRED